MGEKRYIWQTIAIYAFSPTKMQMYPAGYASFSYHCRIGNSSSQRTTKVQCGRGDIEIASGIALKRYGLELPDSNLTIDKERGEISVYRNLALPEKGLSVAYSRVYPSQYGFDEMMKFMTRQLKKDYPESFMADTAISDLFKEYLIRNFGFTERATFSSDSSPKAWIQGRVKFTPTPNDGIPEEHAEYSISLSDSFIEEISEACQKNGKGFSTRRRNILSRREELLKVDTFLRAVDIRPTRSNDENTEFYNNLKKCSSFIVDTIFKDSI